MIKVLDFTEDALSIWYAQRPAEPLRHLSYIHRERLQYVVIHFK